MEKIEYFVELKDGWLWWIFFGVMDGCWRGVGGRELGGGCGGWNIFLGRGGDGVLVVVLDGRVWSRDVLVAGAATAAGRNSKNYHSYVFLSSECMISPI